jgi:hypothetical protein
VLSYIKLCCAAWCRVVLCCVGAVRCWVEWPCPVLCLVSYCLSPAFFVMSERCPVLSCECLAVDMLILHYFGGLCVSVL